MKNPREEALRWLRQAERNLEVAKNNYEHKFYAETCFMSEQTAQVTLKAYLYFQGERYIPVHSVKELATRCRKYNNDFNEFDTYGKILDQYYIPTRYPDALAAPAVPFETYTKEQAEEALKYAQEILKLVKGKIK